MKLDRDEVVTELTGIRTRLPGGVVPDWKKDQGTWQIVFEKGELDYCREQFPAEASFAQVVSWTNDMIIQHNLDGAVIDWF